MYISQAETVSPLQNELAAQTLIPRWIYTASKSQAAGLFPGTITPKFHLLRFLYVPYLYVVYNALKTHNYYIDRHVPGNKPFDCGLAALYIQFGISLGGANLLFNGNTKIPSHQDIFICNYSCMSMLGVSCLEMIQVYEISWIVGYIMDSFTAQVH